MKDSEEVKKSYNKIAAAYHKKRQSEDEGAWNLYLEHPAIMSVLSTIVKGNDVLDIGCGTGILTREIQALGGNVQGVDISDEMIKIARQEHPDIAFHIAHINNLPFENASFEIAASSLVMHYIQDLQPTFTEIARVLRRNGQFVFTMHHPVQLSFTKTKEKHPKNPTFKPYFHNDKYYWEMCGEELLSYQHTFEDVIKNLKKTGFCLLDLIECKPDISVKDRFADYELTSTYPTFCLFHANLL